MPKPLKMNRRGRDRGFCRVGLVRAGLVVCGMAGLVSLAGCAAQSHRDQGLAALSMGDPVSARHHLRRALEHDRGMAAKREFAEAFHVARRDAAVLEGRRALARGEAGTEAALERFGYALQLQPGFGPAQEGLAEARGRAAEALHGRALAAADGGDLELAGRLLDEALAMDPSHLASSRARQSLGVGESGLGASGPLWEAAAGALASARAAADGGRWDESLAELRQMVDDYPDFLPARAAIAAILDRAAADRRQAGDAALAAGDYDAAAAAYRAVLTYRPEDRGVRAALGRVDLGRGDAARRAGEPGRALLHYRAAELRLEDEPERAAVRTGRDLAERSILERTRTVVSLSAEAGDGRLAGVAGDWAGRVRDRLSGSGVVELGSGSGASVALGSGVPSEPVEVALRLEALDVPAPQITTVTRQHRYDVPYQAVNPQLAVYRSRLHHLDLRVGRLRRDWHSCQSSYRASLHLGHDHHHVRQLHWRLGGAERDYHAARRDYRRLHHHYATLPPTVTRYRTEYWDYRVETHSRRAELAGVVRWAGESVAEVRPRVEDRDRVVLDARPDLGLREDPLRLRDDASLEAELIEAAADRAADAVLGRAVAERRRQLLEAADGGSTDAEGGSLEARVAAAWLLKQVDRRAGEAELDALAGFTVDAEDTGVRAD